MKAAPTFFALFASIAVCAAYQRRDPGTTSPERAEYPPLPQTESEKRILATFNDATRSGELYANVPVADGRMLRLLTEAVDAKNVVEIGTSTGLSALWICMALEKTGGKLTTFEIDAHRAALARKHFKQAAVDQLVTVIEGDAHQNITKLKEPIDLVFIDADKGGYVDYLDRMLPLVRPGGLILAHNIDMVPDYVKVVTANRNLETVFYMQGNQLGVTLKKR
ncbi:MAG TPA: class I SAM-dependent methyltransferase [Bryobacteraceae bacterium]|jgi:predicted O-methyltransferase YrrM